MENNFDQQQNDNISINSSVKAYLLESAKWGRFLAIMGYVFIVIMVIVSFSLMITSKFFPATNTNSFQTLGLGALYLLLSGLYIIPITYLHRFSTQVKYGVLNNDELNVEESFKNLKSLFKFSGISTIVILVLYALIFVGAIFLFTAKTL